MKGNEILQTRHHETYQRLAQNIDPITVDSPEVVPPFNNGFELFSAGLAVGYSKNQIDSGEGELSDIVRYSELLGSQDVYASTIEFFERVIAIELVSRGEFDDVPESCWKYVVRYADGGISVLSEEWEDDRNIKVAKHIEAAHDRWDEVATNLSEMISEEHDVGDMGTYGLSN